MPSQTPRVVEDQGAEAKRPTLFERMIGPRQPERPATMAAPVRPQPQVVATLAPAQTNLGIDARSQKLSKSEEELLDIPAFLRRQAN
jgi:cell division protein FtsZ